MNKMMVKRQIFGSRIRQLHTIISQETIKPSSPTPHHLKIHNLSLLDQFAPNIHMPFVLFYPNYKHGDTNILKQSLSQSLSQYYPFAGRFSTPSSSPTSITCNDKGVEFFEASNDCLLEDFIHKNVQDENLDQLFPNGLGCTMNNITGPNLVEIQLNHFSGGGAAVAVSISHKIADGSTIANFINHWSNVTRCRSPINPCFISSSTSSNITMPELIFKDADEVNHATREFVFPNSKLYELKNKVIAMGTAPKNPTRVEILASLLFKHAVNAGARKSGSFEKSNLFLVTNMRNKMIKNYPETTAGNFVTLGLAKMADYPGEMKLTDVIAELRKGKTELEGLSDVTEVGEKLANALSALHGDGSRAYNCSSLCRFPFYEIDFGWGKPVEVTMRIPNMVANGLILMDTPSGDGIKALVHLPEEEMLILQHDEEFLTYVQNI